MHVYDFKHKNDYVYTRLTNVITVFNYKLSHLLSVMFMCQYAYLSNNLISSKCYVVVIWFIHLCYHNYVFVTSVLIDMLHYTIIHGMCENETLTKIIVIL